MLPPESDKVDWEVELPIVIGRSLRRADAVTALDAIAGYTVLNDVGDANRRARLQEGVASGR